MISGHKKLTRVSNPRAVCVPSAENLHIKVDRHDSCYCSDSENAHSDASRTVSTTSEGIDLSDRSVSIDPGSKVPVSQTQSAAYQGSNRETVIRQSVTFEAIPYLSISEDKGTLGGQTLLSDVTDVPYSAYGECAGSGVPQSPFFPTATFDFDSFGNTEVAGSTGQDFPDASPEYLKMVDFALRLGYSEAKLAVVLRKIPLHSLSTDKLLQVICFICFFFSVQKYVAFA